MSYRRMQIAVTLIISFFVAAPSFVVAGAGESATREARSSESTSTRADAARHFPPDRTLIAVFHAHRSTFERLRQMAVEDMQIQAIFSESALSDNLSEAKRQEYKSRLAEIDSHVTLTVDFDGTVRFIFQVRGDSAVGPGSLKGVEFLPKTARPGGPLRRDLDLADKWGDGIFLRPLAGRWFIFFQRTE